LNWYLLQEIGLKNSFSCQPAKAAKRQQNNVGYFTDLKQVFAGWLVTKNLFCFKNNVTE